MINKLENICLREYVETKKNYKEKDLRNNYGLYIQPKRFTEICMGVF